MASHTEISLTREVIEQSTREREAHYVFVYEDESYVRVNHQPNISWFRENQRKSSTISNGGRMIIAHATQQVCLRCLTPFAKTKASPSGRAGSSNQIEEKETAAAVVMQELLQALSKAVWFSR